ncbi:MAG: hypothetical protein U1E76_23315 [Planctomycetota bacterium]
MHRKTALVVVLLVAMGGVVLAQNPPAAAAKPAEAKAPDTNNEAHEFLKSKVDKVMYNLLDKGLKSVIVTSEMNMSMGPMGELAIKTRYVWQADPPREKFAMDDTGLPPQAGAMKGMLEENLKESCRKMILPASMRMKDTQLSLAKTDDGNVAIALPEKTRSMGPMTLKMQETWVYTPAGKLVRTEVRGTNPMTQEPQVQTSTPVLKEVDGRFLVVGTEDKSAQGQGKSELKYEEKDGFQLPVESKSTTQMGDRSIKINVTPNPKLTDADFADAPKPAEKKPGN